ncbi:MAG: Spy/CpxP family protein refolding chaperone [Methylocapsa sp.]|nr:Spy/CpxP family protein refolding chaperone [Methylocapsa sp.]
MTKLKVPRPARYISLVAALALAPLSLSAQEGSMGGMQGGQKPGGAMMQGGGMMGGMQGSGMRGDGMMGGMNAEDMMKNCPMMTMMGGNPEHQAKMMSMMHEKLAHAPDRVTALKSQLKITEAQSPAWNKFADALLSASKSMDTAMGAKHKQMMASGAAPTQPEKLENHAKMASEHAAALQSIKAALDPLYVSLSDEQKKIIDSQRIGPMGLM